MNDRAVFLLLIYFGVLFIFSWVRTFDIPGRGIYLFRAFFPSWKFFEDYGDLPVLFYRLSSNGEKFGGWLPCLARPKRRLSSLLLNPEGNFYLACSSLLQQVVSELEDSDADRLKNYGKTSGFLLTNNLVRFEIAKRDDAGSSLFYQFKICSCVEDVLISPVYKVEGPRLHAG